ASAERAALAILTIDLAAIAENYRMLAAKVAPAECGGVVKADAYGLGVAKVSPALRQAGCCTFFVAMLAEGLALRALLPDVVIYVLDGLHGAAAADFIAAGLRPVLVSRAEVDSWLAAAGDKADARAGLHLDTGMARLGMPLDELDALIAEGGKLQRLRPSLVMSHFACADTPEHPLNREQPQRFRAALERLALPPGVTRSIAASSGIFLGPDQALDLVRPGAALYGIAPLANQLNPMRQVVRLRAKILQVRRVDAGSTVGYGATHRFARQARLATIGVGYADGIMRALSNRGGVYIGDRRAPIVGRVSMDLLTIDISDIPEEQAQPGSWVDLIGPHNPVDTVAAEAGTIGYEILTSLGRRYHRRYLDAGVAPA
ncbi:MAG: alanine racemase, partial [Dongiaceae bacterium]